MHYSVLNEYCYPSRQADTLDLISYPLRASLGGRTINLVKDIEGAPLPIVKRIVLFVITIVIFPIAVVGAICLLGKACYFENKGHIQELFKKTIRYTTDRLCKDPYAFFLEICAKKQNLKSAGFPFLPDFLFLNLCRCEKMRAEDRVYLETESIKLLKRNHSKKDLVTIVSIGPGGSYQEAVYIAKLVRAGYKNIRLALVDSASVPFGSLSGFSECFKNCKITIDKYNGLEDYTQKAEADPLLKPDLFLLIDLSDSQYKVGNELLPDHAFAVCKRKGLLKQGTVIAYSTCDENEEVVSLKSICCSYDGAGSLATIQKNRKELTRTEPKSSV